MRSPFFSSFSLKLHGTCTKLLSEILILVSGCASKVKSSYPGCMAWVWGHSSIYMHCSIPLTGWVGIFHFGVATKRVSFDQWTPTGLLYQLECRGMHTRAHTTTISSTLFPFVMHTYMQHKISAQFSNANLEDIESLHAPNHSLHCLNNGLT